MPASPTLDETDLTHETVTANGIDLHCVTAGPEDGDPVLLLHGFPEFWYSWKHQIPALAAAGFRVVAPDLRGYNRSEKPSGVAAYGREELVGDVVGLLDHYGDGRGHVVGHDWGGLIAWDVAIDRPDVVDRLVVLNAPHPTKFDRLLRSSLAQLRKSWYVGFFQLPILPEISVRFDDYAALESLFEETVTPDAVTETDVERYKSALATPGALTAAINYYRAAGRERLRDLVTGRGVPDQRVTAPTMLIWGEQDSALDPSLTRGLDEWVPDLRVERIPDASHWVQFDASESVSDLLIEFLSGPGR